MDVNNIGNNIVKLRASRGLTQEALGRQIGLTPSAISNIEKCRYIGRVSISETLLNLRK